MEYGVQIDAGSSGSRLYVYQWPGQQFASLPPRVSQVTHTPLASLKVKPGISSCAGEAVGVAACVDKSLTSLLQFARTTLSKQPGHVLTAGVPVFLGATAGMRVLAPSTSEAIMVAVRATLSTASSGFKFEQSWARVLSGEEEGVFGWLASNYLLRTLPSFTEDSKANGGAGPGQLLGALDLGGASTQITFSPRSEEILANFFPLDVGDEGAGASVHERLYSHSFLYFGNDQARIAHQAAEIAKAPGTAALVDDPCLARGFTMPAEGNGSRVLDGTSDWTACLAAAQVLFRPPPGATTQPRCLHADGTRCTWAGVYLPDPSAVRFVAMSYFPLIWAWLGLAMFPQRRPSADLDALASAASRVCAYNISALRAYDATRPQPAGDTYLPRMCFGAAYAHALLHVGYGLPTVDTPVDVIDKVEAVSTGGGNARGSILGSADSGAEITWALGSMLWEVNRLPWNYTLPPSGPSGSGSGGSSGDGPCDPGMSGDDHPAGTGKHPTSFRAAFAITLIALLLTVGTSGFFLWRERKRRRALERQLGAKLLADPLLSPAESKW